MYVIKIIIIKKNNGCIVESLCLSLCLSLSLSVRVILGLFDIRTIPNDDFFERIPFFVEYSPMSATGWALRRNTHASVTMSTHALAREAASLIIKRIEVLFKVSVCLSLCLYLCPSALIWGLFNIRTIPNVEFLLKGYRISLNIQWWALRRR